MTKALFPVSVVALVSIACIGSKGVDRRASAHCDVRSISAVLQEPLRYRGKILCASGIAYRHGRVIEIFDEGFPPVDRFDRALFVDDITDKRLRQATMNARELPIYLEGVIGLQMACYRPAPSGDTCIPYRHPVDVRVRKVLFGRK